MNIFVNANEKRLRAGWRILFQFLIMILIFGVGAFGFSFILPKSHFITSVIPLFVGIITSVWLSARYFDKRLFKEYGIQFNNKWIREFLAGTVIAAVAVSTMFLIEWQAGWLTITGYGWNVPSEVSFGLGISSYFLAMLMVGFHEELFSRGYQVLNLTEGLRYPSIGNRGAVIMAVVLTSSFFGFLHASNPNASLISTCNIFVAGIVLAVPFILTGSLALSAGMHFSWNFVMGGIMGLPVSGNTIEVTVLHIQQGGTDMWTGGAFGPEAGIVGWLGMTIMLGGSCVYIKMSGYELRVADLFKKDYEPAMKSDEQTT